MSSDKGVVHKKGIPAATLTRSQAGLTFEYLPGYVANESQPVATTLPTTGQPITLVNGASPAFFAGLLPEGRRLTAIASRINASLNDDLSLLLDIGSDLVGDVQVLAEGVGPETARDSLVLPGDTSELDFVAIRNDHFGLASTGIPGVQDKVSTRMLSTRAKSTNDDWILKFNPDDVPFAVENENYFLNLAKTCRIRTARHYMVTDKNGVNALLVARFDRPKRDGLVTRLAVEDGCQVLNLYPSDKYNVDLIEVASGLANQCSANRVASFEFLKQVVFSWLTANGDAHAKNFSILENATGGWEMAPAYDLLCTRFYFDDRDMSLPIAGKTSGWDKELLVEFGGELGLNRSVVESVIQQQLRALSQLPNNVGGAALPFERHLRIKAENTLRKRRQALEK